MASLAEGTEVTLKIEDGIKGSYEDRHSQVCPVKLEKGAKVMIHKSENFNLYSRTSAPGSEGGLPKEIRYSFTTLYPEAAWSDWEIFGTRASKPIPHEYISRTVGGAALQGIYWERDAEAIVIKNGFSFNLRGKEISLNINDRIQIADDAVSVNKNSRHTHNATEDRLKNDTAYWFIRKKENRHVPKWKSNEYHPATVFTVTARKG